MGKPGVECKGPDTPKPLESDSCCYPGALLSALTSVVSTECRGAWLVPFQPSPQPSSPPLQWVQDEAGAAKLLSGQP